MRIQRPVVTIKIIAPDLSLIHIYTSHAVGITAKNGAEILIHIGLDTVNLNGQGLHALVQTGDKVKKGTPLIEIDRAFMKEQGIDLTTPMVVTNTSEYKMTIEDAGGHVCLLYTSRCV